MNLRDFAVLRRLRVFFTVSVLALLATAPSALADGSSVWADCGDDGTLNQKHSSADYGDALSNPPADASEYTDCLDQIRAAQLGGNTPAKPSTPGGTPSAGGGTPSTGSSVPPAALAEALTERGLDPAAPPASPDAPAPPVQVGGEKLDLAESPVPSVASALSLPLPLAASAVVVLISAALPLVRYVMARFGPPPTATVSAE